MIADPVVPAGALTPGGDVGLGAGHAFAATILPGAPPLLLTAGHLLEHLEPGSITPAPLAIPGATGLGGKGAAGDIAALPTSSTGGAPPAFELVTEIPQNGLWIATPAADASSKIHFDRARVMTERGGLLYYVLPDAGAAERLGSAAGAPVVDASGRAVAIHLGIAEDRDGSYFGIGNPTSRFLPHLVAALPAAPSGGALAAAAGGAPPESKGKD